MKRIVAFAGSGSKHSINQQLAIYASTLLEQVEVEIIDISQYDLPLFTIDVEQEWKDKGALPKDLEAFVESIRSADALIISLAEHNGSYSAFFKNVWDWTSRVEAKILGFKPFVLLSTSPGGRGGMSVLEAAEDRFPRHGGDYKGKFSLPFYGEKFQDGAIIDLEKKEELIQLLKTL